MEKQEITVSWGPIERKALSYWKKTLNPQWQSVLPPAALVVFCSGRCCPEVWHLVMDQTISVARNECVPSFSPVVTGDEESPRCWAWVLRKVHFLLLILLFCSWLVLELIQRSADYHHMSAKASNQDSVQQMVHPETTELLWKWKEERNFRGTVFLSEGCWVLTL